LQRQTLAPVLQSYAAFDDTLQNLYIQQMEAHRPNVEVIYGLPESSPYIGEVEHISRLPIIFEYLMRNFKLKSSVNFDGYLVLEPRDTILPLQRFPLTYTSTQPEANSVELSLGESKACSLFEIQLSIGYPTWAVLGRPNDLTIQAWDRGKILKQKSLIAIETGRPFSTFFYLGNSDTFNYVFEEDRTDDPHIQFDKLVIKPGYVSLFDVQPSLVNVSGINCIR
jgi:hypothetical protein